MLAQEQTSLHAFVVAGGGTVNVRWPVAFPEGGRGVGAVEVTEGGIVPAKAQLLKVPEVTKL